MSGLQKISRAELYQKIWTTPFVRLAKELGYSYVELVQICADLNVPRPTGGYWYRLSHGGASEQGPLPPAAPVTPTEIALGGRKLDNYTASTKEEQKGKGAQMAPDNELVSDCI